MGDYKREVRKMQENWSPELWNCWADCEFPSACRYIKHNHAKDADDTLSDEQVCTSATSNKDVTFESFLTSLEANSQKEKEAGQRRGRGRGRKDKDQLPGTKADQKTTAVLDRVVKSAEKRSAELKALLSPILEDGI